MVVLTLVLFATLLPLAMSRGDVFVLEDGRQVEGSVIYESETFISVRTREGVVTVERSEIAERRSTSTIYDEFRKRREGLARDDLPGLMGLSEWCIEKQLLEESLQLLRQILNQDPNHAEARARLGYVKIEGDWYLEGSPEAEAARKGEHNPFSAPPVELPDDVEVSKLGRRPEAGTGGSGGERRPRRDLGGAPRLALTTRESYEGKEPEFSVGNYELSRFLSDLDEPITVRDGEGARYQGELTIAVRFQRTHHFYGRVPISHIYDCQASLKIVDGESGRTVVRLDQRFSFSGSARRDRQEVAEAGYHYTVRMLMHHVSRQGFFRQRGARLIEAPAW